MIGVCEQIDEGYVEAELRARAEVSQRTRAKERKVCVVFTGEARRLGGDAGDSDHGGWVGKKRQNVGLVQDLFVMSIE
jgi:hypothetical protein